MRAVARKPAVLAVLPLLVAGQLIGVPFGVRLLLLLSPAWLRLLLGLAMLAFVAHHHHEQRAQQGADGGEEAAGTGPAGAAAAEVQGCTDASAPDGLELQDMGATAVVKEQWQQHQPVGAGGGSMAGEPKPVPQEPEEPAVLSVLWGLPFGVVSGVLSGALNEGGPPVSPCSKYGLSSNTMALINSGFTASRPGGGVPGSAAAGQRRD